MIEFSGWATVRDTPGESDLTQSELVDVFSPIRQRVQELQATTNTLLADRWLNGDLRLVVAGAANHLQDFPPVLDLFKLIATSAPGSYGLLSLHDDESPDHGNEFRTWVLRRGTLAEHPDPFLSPLVPTVEDPSI